MIDTIERLEEVGAGILKFVLNSYENGNACKRIADILEKISRVEKLIRIYLLMVVD